MEILQYKAYDAAAEFDAERQVWSCKILFIDDFVSFEAATPDEIQASFEAAVDDYLGTRNDLGTVPQQPDPCWTASK